MEDLWEHLIEFCGSERIFFSLSLFLVHKIVFIPLNLLLTYARSHNWWPQYRINHNEPSPELVGRALKEITINQILEIVLYYLIYPIFIYCGLSVRVPFPSFKIIIAHVFVCMMCEDTLFYWSHRALHHRSIYKYVHKKHHEFINTIGITSEYSHPFEMVVSGLIPTYSGVLLLGSHHIVFLIWYSLRVFETVDSHSGFEFPWSPWNMFLSIQGGSARHDFHHSHNMGSYGSFTKFWDWVMGTDIHFKEFQNKQRQQRKQRKKTK